MHNLNGQKMMRTSIEGLYAIADTLYLTDVQLVSAVSAAIVGGARLVQYRDKKHDATKRTQQASELSALCRKQNVLFIVNDDVELARRVNADGVHLGRDDVSLVTARKQLGAAAVIGVSCYNELARAQQAQAQGADYVAFGRFFPSATKPQAVLASPDLLRAAKQKIRLPLVAIGGITPENGAVLISAGADALAVIEGVFGQTDIRAAARRYAQLFNL